MPEEKPKMCLGCADIPTLFHSGYVKCMNEKCGLHMTILKLEDWNKRPIENYKKKENWKLARWYCESCGEAAPSDLMEFRDINGDLETKALCSRCQVEFGEKDD